MSYAGTQVFWPTAALVRRGGVWEAGSGGWSRIEVLKLDNALDAYLVWNGSNETKYVGELPADLERKFIAPGPRKGACHQVGPVKLGVTLRVSCVANESQYASLDNS